MRPLLRGSGHAWIWPALIVVLFAVLAGGRGTDINWDLRNYHIYNAQALLTGRFWTDIAAAQLQTFFAPALDILLGVLSTRLNQTPVLLNMALALPHALAVCLALALTRRMLPPALPGGALIAFGATLFGAAGAAGLPLLATSMDDALPASCVLGGLLLLVIDTRRPYTRAACSGLLFGLAAGLKLTEVSYCLAGGITLLLVPHRAAQRLGAMLVFVLCGVVGAAAVSGAWWWLLFERYHNPVLPFMNQWFGSPFVDRLPHTDERFKPAGLAQALAYPYFWAFRRSTWVAELPMRDPRFALAYIAACACAVRVLVCGLRGLPGMDRAGRSLLTFFVTAFVIWEVTSSVFRYLAVLELLTGAIVLLAVQPLLAVPQAQVPGIVGLLAVGIATQAMTVYPDWARLPAPTALQAQLPELPPGSMVVLLDPSPMAYLAALLPPEVRFVGANNNLIQPGKGGLLSQQAEAAVRLHAGPLYGLEDAAEAPGIADQTLAFYGLARDGCSQVSSNLDNNAIRLCRLRAAAR